MTPEKAREFVQEQLSKAEDDEEVRLWVFIAGCVDARVVLEGEYDRIRAEWKAKGEANYEAVARRKAQATVESKVVPGLKRLIADLRIDRFTLYDEDY